MKNIVLSIYITKLLKEPMIANNQKELINYSWHDFLDRVRYRLSSEMYA